MNIDFSREIIVEDTPTESIGCATADKITNSSLTI